MYIPVTKSKIILLNFIHLLDGNNEEALANITCTPNIKNDYGAI